MITSRTRLHGLDTLRATAIVAVVLYHLTIFGELPQSWMPLTGYGWMGVDLFFVLSGFLIGQQLLRPYRDGGRPSLPEFYRRRAWRILPAYLVMLALYLAVPAWREAPHLPPLWKMLTFTMNIGFDSRQGAFSHAWSLCVEEHFYLLLPLLVLLTMRRPSWRRTVLGIGVVVLGGMALRWWLAESFPDEIGPLIYRPTWSRLDGLTAGLALATLRTFRPAFWARLLRRGHLLTIAGVLCVGATLWLFPAREFFDTDGRGLWGVVVGLPLLALGWALLTASAMSTNGLLARWRVFGAETLATLAFSLYLTHKEIAHLLHEHLPSVTAAQGPASWLLYGLASLFAASVLHATVERPCLRLRDRHSQAAPASGEEGRSDPAL